VNRSTPGVAQSTLDQLVADTELFGLVDAMRSSEISFFEISSSDDVFHFLFNNLEWDAAQLLWRWIWTYRTTGEIPRLVVQVAA